MPPTLIILNSLGFWSLSCHQPYISVENISRVYIGEIWQLSLLCLSAFNHFSCFISHFSLSCNLIMDSTNTNSIVLSPADLALMEWLFNHMRPGAAPFQDPPSNPQPSLIHSLPPPSAQLSQPTLHYSTLITG